MYWYLMQLGVLLLTSYCYLFQTNIASKKWIRLSWSCWILLFTGKEPMSTVLFNRTVTRAEEAPTLAEHTEEWTAAAECDFGVVRRLLKDGQYELVVTSRTPIVRIPNKSAVLANFTGPRDETVRKVIKIFKKCCPADIKLAFFINGNRMTVRFTKKWASEVCIYKIQTSDVARSDKVPSLSDPKVI